MNEQRQISKIFKGKGGRKLNYLLYLPKEYKSFTRVPIMFFLHGAGERGSNINLIKKYGPPELIEKGMDFPFILISPQCPENIWWSADILIYFIDQLIKELEPDTNRVYLTGLSMGGFGTWELAQNYPDKFAAIAPVCGGGNPDEACKIKDLPIWIFHGEKDSVVPLYKSLEMIEALKNCGSDPLVTIYPDVGHDSWIPAYNNSNIFNWFLKQKKS